MRISFTLLLTIALSIQLFPQKLSPDYFDNNIEVYFSFEFTSKDLIRELSDVVSIDKIEGSTVYAYANNNEYERFLNFNIEHAILQKPGELIFPEMSNDISEINDWDVYPTYDAYVNLMMQFAVNYPTIWQISN